MQPATSDAEREQGVAASLAIGQAWLACLRFTLALLQTGSPADPISDLSICPEAERAQAFLH